MSDSRLYSRLLLPKGHGYPLFHPQPFDDLPLESRRIGTDIGDVGVVTSDGSFDVIFNICRAANDPVNRFGVPEGFEQVKLNPGDIAPRAQYHRPGSDVSNTTISKRRLDVDAGVDSNVFLPLGAGAVVEISTSSKETAVLLLPDGASRTDLRHKKKFRDYALKYAHRWYAFVNGPKLGREVNNGDLYLVTGTDKSFSWSVAAIENHSEDCKISLKLKAAQVGSAGTSCFWQWETANSFANSGPRPLPEDEDRSENQTVFLRGFKVAISSSPLRKPAKAISIVDSKPSDILSKAGAPPYSQSPPTGTGSFFRSPTSGGSGPSDDEESVDASAEYFPPNVMAYHPASAINEYLLNSSPTASVAVAHDDEWVSVLDENDAKFPDDAELIRRISGKYTILMSSDGIWLHDSSKQVSSAALHDSAVEHHEALNDHVSEALGLQEPQGSSLLCRAMHDYEATDATGLTFRLNDIIKVLVQQPSGWWNGVLGEERGWFPSNYVSLIDEKEIELPPCSSGSDVGVELASSDDSIPRSHADDAHQKVHNGEQLDAEISYLSGVFDAASWLQETAHRALEQLWHQTKVKMTHRLEEDFSDEDTGPTRLPGACVRCKQRKVKCEFKSSADSCERCFHNGHDCRAPRQKKTHPKRRRLLGDISSDSAAVPLSTPSMDDSETSSTSKSPVRPIRKHRKLLKDGAGTAVWPESVETIFVQGLREYRDSAWATYSRGRTREMNQFLVDYLQNLGITRSKEQVASHIQVLREKWKGEPEYHLVAGNEGHFVSGDEELLQNRFKYEYNLEHHRSVESSSPVPSLSYSSSSTPQTTPASSPLDSSNKAVRPSKA